MAHCLTILEVMKWFLFLGEERDVFRLVVVKRREETRTFSLVFINANVLFFFFLFPPETHSNQPEDRQHFESR